MGKGLYFLVSKAPYPPPPYPPKGPCDIIIPKPHTLNRKPKATNPMPEAPSPKRWTVSEALNPH